MASAIETLLQSLTQPPAPQVTPQAPPMLPPPTATDGPGDQFAPPPPEGITDRIKGLLSHFDPRPNAPGGYDSLLSPQEIQSARPGILQSLIGTPDAPSARQQFQNNLDNIVKTKMLAMQIGQQRHVMQARARMAGLFPEGENETLDQTRDRLGKMYAYAMANGDEETMKDIGSTLRGIMTQPRLTTVAPGAAVVDAQGNPTFQNPNKPTNYVPQAFILPNGDTTWVRPGDPVPAGAKPLSLQKTDITVNAANDRANATRDDKAVNNYMTQIKPLRDRAAVIDQALKTIGDAADERDPNKQKALYSSAIANFIQAADQKAQIRWQLLNYYKENIDPSIEGKWNVLRSRLLQGTLPGYTMQALLSHLQGLRAMVHTEIDAQRKGLVKRRPELDNQLPDTDEFFPTTAGAEPPPSSGAGRSVVINGKTYTVKH